MHYSRYALAFLLLAVCTPVVYGSSGTDRISIPTGRGAEIELISGDTGHVSYNADGDFIWDAPVGDRALFAYPLPDGVSVDDYGLIKLDIAIEGGPADIMMFIEKPGEKRRVYRPVDVFMPPKGFRTIHFDIACPEIVREGHDKPVAPRIAFNLWAMDTGYPDQEPRRRITVRNVRLSRRHLDVSWNGVDYRRVDTPGDDLVYEYPVTVRNDDGVARTVEGSLTRTTGRYGVGEIVPERYSLAPGDSTVFTVRLNLPRGKAGEFPPLYCEWFQPLFGIVGISDSDEGILRSSDLLSLPLIVMPDFEGPVAFYDEDGLGEMQRLYKSTNWGKQEGDRLIENAESILAGDLSIPDGPGWARAYYYCHEHRCVLQYQGPDKHYCPVGGEYRTVDFDGVDLDRDYRAGEHNTTAAQARTLALAYALTGDSRFAEGARSILGQYRDAYFTYDWMDLDTSRITIDKGRMHFAKYMETYPFRNMIEALDILKAAGGVPENEAHDIEDNLFKPGLVEITDYRMDVLCRQTTITTTALIGGLALRHAPLVAFAVSSPFGYYSLRRWGATADGIAHGHGYSQNGYAFHMCEMASFLNRCGADTFDHELKRLVNASFRWSVPFDPGRMSRIFAIAARHWPDPDYRRYAGRSLFAGEPPPYRGEDAEITPQSVNFPNSGLSILRMPDGEGGTLDAEFKWGMPDNRGSFSVLSLGLNFFGQRCQSYPGHFHWGSTDLHHGWQIQSASHTTVVVDARNQSGMRDYFKGHYMPHPSEQLFFEECDDYAATVAFNDRIYPGVSIWRAVCVLDGAYLVADMLRSDTVHTYDWWFHGVPDHSNGREGIDANLRPCTAPLGSHDGYDMVYDLSSADVTGDLLCDWAFPGDGGVGLDVRVLNNAPLEAVHGFEWSRQFSAPEKEFLLLRRDNARNADFVVLAEPHHGDSCITRFERAVVRDVDGVEVDGALCMEIDIDGKRYRVVLNPDRRKVECESGTTRNVLVVESE